MQEVRREVRAYWRYESLVGTVPYLALYFVYRVSLGITTISRSSSPKSKSSQPSQPQPQPKAVSHKRRTQLHFNSKYNYRSVPFNLFYYPFISSIIASHQSYPPPSFRATSPHPGKRSTLAGSSNKYRRHTIFAQLLFTGWKASSVFCFCFFFCLQLHLQLQFRFLS